MQLLINEPIQLDKRRNAVIQKRTENQRHTRRFHMTMTSHILPHHACLQAQGPESGTICYKPSTSIKRTKHDNGEDVPIESWHRCQSTGDKRQVISLCYTKQLESLGAIFLAVDDATSRPMLRKWSWT